MNRIAVEADKAIYGDYITVGDLIIDTPNKSFADGSKEVLYYFMVKDWPTLREGAVIWIDGEKLGYVRKIQFRNTANGQTPWLIKSASIKNIPHTKIVCGGLSCHGLLNLTVSGVSEKYQGLLRWSPSRRFATGHFGIHVKSANMFSGHGIELSTLNHGSVKIEGFEIQHGFSGVRLYSAAIDMFVSGIDISNFYIHDTCGGEGFYIGSTQAGTKAKIKNLKIKNGFLARTAAEAVQLQHMIGGAEVSDLIVYAADTDWLHAFQAHQDTAIQWVVASGFNKLSNVIVDGFAAQSLCPFGSDQDVANASLGQSVVENILFNDGRKTGSYLHNSAHFGMNWTYKDLYYRAFNNTYSDRTGEKAVPYIISNRHGTDPVKYEKIIHDGSKPEIFENPNAVQIGEIVLDKSLPAPKYINSGFGNAPAHTIKIWHQYFGNYFDGPNYTPTEWKFGEIAIDAREDGTYVFCKCIQEHITATGTTVLRPKESPMFLQLTWDANGIRNDQAGHDATSAQSLFPPDDFRLAVDCYWKAKGMGVKNIIQKEEIIDRYVYDGEIYIVTDCKTYKAKV
jgi:hypothetical protein